MRYNNKNKEKYNRKKKYSLFDTSITPQKQTSELIPLNLK